MRGGNPLRNRSGLFHNFLESGDSTMHFNRLREPGYRGTWGLLILVLALALSLANSGCIGVAGSNQAPNGNPTTPATSNAGTSKISSTSATITWTTNVSATSQVEYGTTTSYGSLTALDRTLVTSHAQVLSGLSAGTVYHYRVRSRDANNVEVMSADQTLTTAQSSDPIPPSVSITSPASGATVSSTITVFASASDNVGVAGVQFQVDGANTGAEVTSFPYTYFLNTTTLADGNHTATATARDTAGNKATSVAVTIK